MLEARASIQRTVGGRAAVSDSLQGRTDTWTQIETEDLCELANQNRLFLGVRVRTKLGGARGLLWGWLGLGEGWLRRMHPGHSSAAQRKAPRTRFW